MTAIHRVSGLFRSIQFYSPQPSDDPCGVGPSGCHCQREASSAGGPAASPARADDGCSGCADSHRAADCLPPLRPPLRLLLLLLAALPLLPLPACAVFLRCDSFGSSAVPARPSAALPASAAGLRTAAGGGGFRSASARPSAGGLWCRPLPPWPPSPRLPWLGGCDGGGGCDADGGCDGDGGCDADGGCGFPCRFLGAPARCRSCARSRSSARSMARNAAWSSSSSLFASSSRLSCC